LQLEIVKEVDVQLNRDGKHIPNYNTNDSPILHKKKSNMNLTMKPYCSDRLFAVLHITTSPYYTSLNNPEVAY